MSSPLYCRDARWLLGLAASSLTAACVEPSPPTGIAFLRISEVAGACPLEDTIDGPNQVPTDLPFRRAKATASFRASTRYPGGHYVSIGYADDDGRLGMLQMEVPPERGYGISQLPAANITQALGFAEWQGDQLLFAAQSVAGGYVNYFGANEGGGELPGKLYVLTAFDSKDASDNVVCRIVAVHASAERERVTPFDPSWLEPRPGLLITAENEAFVPPTLDNLASPSNAPVAPADAPPDRGDAAPPMTVHRANFFPTGGGGSSPCD